MRSCCRRLASRGADALAYPPPPAPPARRRPCPATSPRAHAPTAARSRFPRLHTLCVYRNHLGDLRGSLDALRGCAKLRVLDLDGNPCARARGYKHHTLRALGRLGTLDGDTVTPLDRDLMQVGTWVVVARRRRRRAPLLFCFGSAPVPRAPSRGEWTGGGTKNASCVVVRLRAAPAN